MDGMIVNEETINTMNTDTITVEKFNEQNDRSQNVGS